jgi:hypothetical protein
VKMDVMLGFFFSFSIGMWLCACPYVVLVCFLSSNSGRNGD